MTLSETDLVHLRHCVALAREELEDEVHARHARLHGVAPHE